MFRLNLILAFLLPFGLFGQVRKIESIAINDSAWVINESITLAYPLELEQIKEVLGKPSRFKEARGGANDIYFWSQHGIMVFCKRSTERVNSFEICFRRTWYYETFKMYKGDLSINGVQLSKNSSSGDLMSIDNDEFTHDEDIFFAMHQKNIVVTMELHEKKRKLAGVSIGSPIHF